MLPYRDAFSLPEKFKRPHSMPPAEVNGQLHDFLVAEDDAPTIPAAEKVAAAAPMEIDTEMPSLHCPPELLGGGVCSVKIKRKIKNLIKSAF